MKHPGKSVLPLLSSNKASLREVEKIVDKLEIEPSGNLDVCSSGAAHVAALQMQLKPYSSLAEYVVDMNLYISDAVNRRAQLIVMPAFAGLMPVNAAPNAHTLIQKLIPSDDEKEDFLLDLRGLNELLSHLSDYAFDAYFHTVSTLAARHGIYIMAGSTLYFEGTELCHRAFLFNSEGELAGYQDKIGESPLEQGLQISPESEVKLFDTPLGSLSILICSDAYYYECARIAKSLGAKLLICPNAFVDEYSPIDSSLGPNMRAQENCVYAVQSSLVGETGLGFSLEGGGRIFVPNTLLGHKNGIAAKTSGRHEPDIICVPLDLDRLDELKDPYKPSLNTDFIQKYVDRLY